VTIVLMALATWRIANMLADTDQSGPFNLLDKFRLVAGVRFDAQSQPYPINNFAEGLLCVTCNSVWIGIGFAALYAASPVAAFWFSLPLVFSAVAMLLNRWIGA
jgi:hypothetical protein